MVKTPAFGSESPKLDPRQQPLVQLSQLWLKQSNTSSYSQVYFRYLLSCILDKTLNRGSQSIALMMQACLTKHFPFFLRKINVKGVTDDMDLSVKYLLLVNVLFRSKKFDTYNPVDIIRHKSNVNAVFYLKDDFYAVLGIIMCQRMKYFYFENTSPSQLRQPPPN